MKKDELERHLKGKTLGLNRKPELRLPGIPEGRVFKKVSIGCLGFVCRVFRVCPGVFTMC